MEVKGHALFWGAVSSSVLLGSADTIGGERKKKKPQIQFQACSVPLFKGQPLHSQGEQNVVGSTEENNYWFSCLESATLFRCVGK